MKLSIILPARNEESLIKSTISDISKHLKNKPYSYEILVVVNGTTDNTAEIVKKMSENDKRIVLMGSKPGYGVALRKGLKVAKGDFIIIFNVDYYNLYFIDLVDINLYGKDIIIGSKRTFWAEDDRSFSRKIVSLFFNLFLKVMFGFKGSDTHGIKIIKKEVVSKILNKCKTDSDIFYTELIIRAQRFGFKFADFPVKIEEKRPSRFTFSDRTLRTPLNIYQLYIALQNK